MAKKNKKKNIINTIKYAIENKKVYPFFQPIIDNKTKEIIKYETLMRIYDKNGNIVLPNDFLPVAVKKKLYFQLNKILIEKIFTILSEKKDLNLSINLSIKDIFNKEIFNYLIFCLKQNKSNERIIFEIIESKEIKNFKRFNKNIIKIRDLGAKIAIDDFGNGYSNFSYLLNLSFDYLKIDGSLIRNIINNDKYIDILKNIVEFSKIFNAKTIAEYVHSEEIFNIIKEVNIDYSQGYFFGKPQKKIIESQELRIKN